MALEGTVNRPCALGVFFREILRRDLSEERYF